VFPPVPSGLPKKSLGFHTISIDLGVQLEELANIYLCQYYHISYYKVKIITELFLVCSKSEMGSMLNVSSQLVYILLTDNEHIPFKETRITRHCLLNRLSL